MYLLSNDQIRSIEKYAIEDLGMPGIVLMERAALKVTEWLVDHYETSLSIVVVCGPGNNGGDGMAIARQLLHHGFSVRCFLLGHRDRIVGDAKINYDLTKQLLAIEDVSGLEGLTCDLVVDALFGTGLTKDIQGEGAMAIDWMNDCPIRIAVDMPSGIGPTGRVMGKAVKATTTLTFAMPKHGNIFYPGSHYNGQVITVDIGLPEIAYRCLTLKDYLLTSDRIKAWIPERSADAHKGQCGHLMVASGSSGMVGAAILNCKSAMRMGTGLVTLVMEDLLNPLVAGAVPEVMTLALEDETITGSSSLEETMTKADAFLLGSGAGHSDAFKKLLHKALKMDKPAVLDADAINLLSMDLSPLDFKHKKWVLTPHIGEMSRLTGLTTKAILASPLDTARAFALKYQVVLVLKSARTIVALPNGDTYTNLIGNSGMATAGSGDVLAGMIAGLMAQGLCPEHAAMTGTYLHSLAGDLALKDQGVPGLMAGDIIDAIKSALKMTI